MKVQAKVALEVNVELNDMHELGAMMEQLDHVVQKYIDKEQERWRHPQLSITNLRFTETEVEEEEKFELPF